MTTYEIVPGWTLKNVHGIISLETDYKFDDLVETPSVHCSHMLCGMKGKDTDDSTV